MTKLRHWAAPAAAAILLGLASHAGAQTIRIGTLQALTGPGASYGQDAVAGMRLAIEEINAAGGIGGRRLELVTRDDEGRPPRGRQLAEQLVYRDNVAVLFANTLTTPNLASQEVTTPAGVPHVVAGTTSDVVCTPRGAHERPCPANVFRLAILNSWQGKALADYVADTLRLRRVAVLHDSTEYGQDGWRMLSEPLRARGIEIVYTGTFGFGERNFRPHMLRIQEARADAILTWTLDFLVAQIAIARSEAGLAALPLLGSSATTTFAYRELGREAAEGTLIVDGMPPVMPNPSPVQAQIIERSAREANRDARLGVQYWTLTYYDAMHWVAAVMRDVGTDRQAIIRAMGTTHGSFTGRGTGAPYRFTTEERNGRDPGSTVMVQIRSGQIVRP
jgi:branched-chain amino acid transport system substrate-binding protein